MERVILVGINLPRIKKREIQNSLSELSKLAETAGATPEITVIQGRKSIDPAFFIGQGKALELKDIAKENKIRTIIIDEDLKPVQQRNLEEMLEVKIIDRSRLILDIFAKRARSKEGKLQVELAQLNYFLPRITERFGRFEQQVGGIGTRGPGEKKLEVDKRRIRDRIALLDRETENIRLHRHVMRSKRNESGHPTVAIAGYTNSGKSTLLNTLSNRQSVYADNKLFATLDPTTRQVQLPGGRVVLFSDTVGFIRKLPHTLIAAFRATLEEITGANCIIHLIDASQPDYIEHTQTTIRVLKELNAEHIPSIPVYNKVDLLPKEKQHKLKRQGNIIISAKKSTGLYELLKNIEKIIIPQLKSHRFILPYNKSQHLKKIYDLSVVKKQSYSDDGIRLYLESTPEHWEKIRAIIRAS